jgi:glycosyltransferase involved in cell wall biosynthesis
MENGLFSIVIPCKNEEAYIGKTLHSIEAQSVLNPTTPIIIADADSTDGTLQVIRRFQQRLNIKVISGGLPPTGRNRAARLCNSKYIAFMDADVMLGHSDTLQQVLQTAEEKELDLVIPQILISNANIMDKVFEGFYYWTAKWKILGAFGTGMFIFIKTEAFRNLGEFNEELILGDDWELTHQIKSERFALADTAVYTSHRRFLAQGYLHTFYQWTSIAASKKYRAKGHREYFYNDYN